VGLTRAQFVPNSLKNSPTTANTLKQQNPHFQRVLLMARHLQV